MAYYLLKVEQLSGEHEFVENHVIEAENEQMVKYHYHRTLKDMGWSDYYNVGGKHLLEGYRGLGTDILSIRELYQDEYQTLKKYLPQWVKI